MFLRPTHAYAACRYTCAAAIQSAKLLTATLCCNIVEACANQVLTEPDYAGGFPTQLAKQAASITASMHHALQCCEPVGFSIFTHVQGEAVPKHCCGSGEV